MENQPPKPEINRWRRMIELHSLGELSEAEFAELNTAMAESREVRDLYRRSCHADMRLQRLSSEADLPGKSSPRAASFFARPIAAAAAGLILGVFCTSAIWAASEAGRETILTLFQDSFESGPDPVPAGGPVPSDAWGGDYAEIVTGTRGIEPVEGKRMLGFLRADYEGKENAIGYVGDLYRLIDLREQESILADGMAIVTVEAALGSSRINDPERFVASLSLNALESVPESSEEWRSLISTPRSLEELALAAARRSKGLALGESWQPIEIELRLPRETRFLLVGLHVADHQAMRKHGITPPAVRFEGQFADDVRVTLRKVRQ